MLPYEQRVVLLFGPCGAFNLFGATICAGAGRGLILASEACALKRKTL